MATPIIESYLTNLEDKAKASVLSFANFMEAEFPWIQPRISYSMPMWWIGSKMYDGYVGISIAKGHFSIHFYDESYITKLKNLLPSAKFGKRCINIPYGDAPATELTYQMVKSYLSAHSS